MELQRDPTVRIDDDLRRALERADWERVSSEYLDQDELVVLDQGVPAGVLEQLQAELDRLKDRVHRNHIPTIRKGGNIGYREIIRNAPAMTALYRSPYLIEYVSRLAGKRLFLKSPKDEHACTLYFYSEARDKMRFHYDTCGCEDGASYTVIIGLVNRTQATLRCRLHTKNPHRAERELAIATHPGSVVIFCGSKIYHAVTPLRAGEYRAVLSLSYVTEQKQPKGFWRFTENAKDSLLYFGLPALMQKNYRD